MNDQAKISMNAAQRSALRKAITAHSDWRLYAARRALKIESMSTGQLLDAAYDLGISPDTYMSAENLSAAEKAFDDGIFVPKSTPSTEGAGAALAALIGQIAGQSMSREAIEAMVDARLNEALERVPAIRIEIKGADGQARKVEGHKHPKLATLLRACTARMSNGYVPNVWIAGPAGSGKTHSAGQVAKAFGLTFHSHGAVGQPYEVLGFIDAAGKYHRTPFREAYEFGGVCLMDECDGSDNPALLALNAALANGHCTFPDRVVERHKDCIVLASANTFGLGATAEYVGRSKIDAAFLSRFPVKLDWDYDAALERNISGHEKFTQRVQDARKRARAAGLKILIDPRHSQSGAALIAAGFSEKDAANLTYLAGLKKEDRKTVEGDGAESAAD